MPLIRYVPRGKSEYGTVLLTAQVMKFDTLFLKDFLHSTTKVVLYYDEERRILAVEPHSDGVGIKIGRKGDICRVNIAGFNRHFKLSFSSPILKKAVKQDDMIIVQL